MSSAMGCTCCTWTLKNCRRCWRAGMVCIMPDSRPPRSAVPTIWAIRMCPWPTPSGTWSKSGQVGGRSGRSACSRSCGTGATISVHCACTIAMTAPGRRWTPWWPRSAILLGASGIGMCSGRATASANRRNCGSVTPRAFTFRPLWIWTCFTNGICENLGQT